MAGRKHRDGGGSGGSGLSWGGFGSYANFVQNRRPGVHPGILDAYLAIREADRVLAASEDLLREQYRLSGLSADEAEAAIRETRRGTPLPSPLLATAFLVLFRAVVLVTLNVAWFVLLFLLVARDAIQIVLDRDDDVVELARAVIAQAEVVAAQCWE